MGPDMDRERHGKAAVVPAALAPAPPCSLNSFLKSVDVGDYILQGDLEAYSCRSHRGRRGACTWGAWPSNGATLPQGNAWPPRLLAPRAHLDCLHALCRQASRPGQEALQEPGPGGPDRQLPARALGVARRAAVRVRQVGPDACGCQRLPARYGRGQSAIACCTQQHVGHTIHAPNCAWATRVLRLGLVSGPRTATSPPSPPRPRSRKTLIYLILTLNNIYPDYDFSQLRAQHFQKEDGLSRAEETVDSHLLEVSKVRLGVWGNIACISDCTAVSRGTGPRGTRGKQACMGRCCIMHGASHGDHAPLPPVVLGVMMAVDVQGCIWGHQRRHQITSVILSHAAYAMHTAHLVT